MGSKFHCTKIEDRNGNAITLGYTMPSPGVFRLSTITDSSSRQISLTYTGSRITSVTSPQSRSWSISYNGNGEANQITWPSVGGNSYNVQLGYDANHCITSYTDRRGKTSTASFNADGSIAWEKDPYLNQISYSYAANQTTITCPNGKVTKHNYTSGKLTSIEDPLAYTEQFRYDSANNVDRYTDKRGKIWDSTFDTKGNRLTLTNPLSKVTTWTWNSFNDPLTVTCDDGHQTVNTYNASGNLT